MLKRVLERAGIPKVRFHDLRHTFATIALQNGVDIKTVSGMLGHFSAGFTLDTYAHVTTSAQKEAAQTINQLIKLLISQTHAVVTESIGIEARTHFIERKTAAQRIVQHR